jgi:Cu+-exporting ATPase
VVLVAVDAGCIGAIGLSDTPRRESQEAVEQLRGLGVGVAMVTGDHRISADAVAASLGIDQVHAEVTPDQKLEEVRRLQRSGRRVVFVGDGINDAPALTAAEAGIAFSVGTDIAVEAADLTLIHEDLRLVPRAILIARRTVGIIKQNLFWAFVYNVAAIPLAAFGKISPSYAAAAMMVSSITVVLNSLRLKRA